MSTNLYRLLVNMPPLELVERFNKSDNKKEILQTMADDKFFNQRLKGGYANTYKVLKSYRGPNGLPIYSDETDDDKRNVKYIRIGSLLCRILDITFLMGYGAGGKRYGQSVDRKDIVNVLIYLSNSDYEDEIMNVLGYLQQNDKIVPLTRSLNQSVLKEAFLLRPKFLSKLLSYACVFDKDFCYQIVEWSTSNTNNINRLKRFFEGLEEHKFYFNLCTMAITIILWPRINERKYSKIIEYILNILINNHIIISAPNEESLKTFQGLETIHNKSSLKNLFAKVFYYDQYIPNNLVPFSEDRVKSMSTIVSKTREIEKIVGRPLPPLYIRDKLETFNSRTTNYLKIRNSKIASEDKKDENLLNVFTFASFEECEYFLNISQPLSDNELRKIILNSIEINDPTCLQRLLIEADEVNLKISHEDLKYALENIVDYDIGEGTDLSSSVIICLRLVASANFLEETVSSERYVEPLTLSSGLVDKIINTKDLNTIKYFSENYNLIPVSPNSTKEVRQLIQEGYVDIANFLWKTGNFQASANDKNILNKIK